MAVYKIINDNIRSIFDFIESNDNIKRLLSFDGDPLDADKQVPSIRQLINDKQLYKRRHIPEVKTKTDSYICVYHENASNSNSIYNKDANIIIDILIHEDNWVIQSGELEDDIRALVIMDEIDTNLPLENIKSHRGNVVFKDSYYLDFMYKFQGYRMIYELTNEVFDY